MAVLRSRIVKEPLSSRLLFPVTERAFTYERLDAWLAKLEGIPTVTLAELEAANGPVLGLRHDIDRRLDSALEMARLEHARGIRATYFVLSTAPYYRSGDPALLRSLRRLQDEYGHEVGWHNDLLTLQKVHGVDAAEHLRRELGWLRGGGVDIRGTAAHGSPWCHRLGYHNNYIFIGWDDPVAGFPARDVVEKLDPAEFGLEYEAYHLGYDTYFSDSRFVNGRRWHPEQAVPGERTVILLHPCHWDRSSAAKSLRLTRTVARRLTRGPMRA
jgi:hypothetical protein